MSRLRRQHRLLGVLMAAGAGVLTACADPPTMTEADAKAFAEAAWREIGLDGAVVQDAIEPTRCGQPAAAGWETHTRVPSGGTASLCVARDEGRALFLKDVGPGGVGPLLTEQQFRRLEAFRFNPATERRAREMRAPSLVASSLVAVVGAAHLAYGFRRRRHRGH